MYFMNEELFNEATKSNVLSKKLIDQLQESMSYSSISFINWTIEVLTLIKNRLERGDRITDEVSGGLYTAFFPGICKEKFLLLHNQPGLHREHQTGEDLLLSETM